VIGQTDTSSRFTRNGGVSDLIEGGRKHGTNVCLQRDAGRCGHANFEDRSHPKIPLLAGSDLSINGTRDCVENRMSTRAVILTAEAVGDVPLTSSLDSSRTSFVLSVSSGRAANSREA